MFRFFIFKAVLVFLQFSLLGNRYWSNFTAWRYFLLFGSGAGTVPTSRYRTPSSTYVPCSVADPGCLSRIPDPDFYPSRIPDPKTATKDRGENFFCQTIFCSHKFHKTEYDMLKKKIWHNFPRIIEVFTQKIVTKPSKIWVWDPGSGKNLFRIPDPGVKNALDPGSRIRIRNTGTMLLCEISNFHHNTVTVPCYYVKYQIFIISYWSKEKRRK